MCAKSAFLGTEETLTTGAWTMYPAVTDVKGYHRARPAEENGEIVFGYSYQAAKRAAHAVVSSKI